MQKLVREKDILVLRSSPDSVFNRSLRDAMINEGVYLYYFLVFLREYQDESKQIDEITKD